MFLLRGDVIMLYHKFLQSQQPRKCAAQWKRGLAPDLAWGPRLTSTDSGKGRGDATRSRSRSMACWASGCGWSPARDSTTTSTGAGCSTSDGRGSTLASPSESAHLSGCGAELSPQAGEKIWRGEYIDLNMLLPHRLGAPEPTLTEALQGRRSRSPR